MGRNLYPIIPVRLSPAHVATLDELCERLQTTRTDAIRQSIAHFSAKTAKNTAKTGQKKLSENPKKNGERA